MSALGVIGSSAAPKTTHLLAICAAIWAKKQNNRSSATRFLSAFRRWTSDHGQTGMQIADLILRRLRTEQQYEYDRAIVSDADKLRDTIILTLGLTEHLGEVDQDRYEIALRAAVWAHIEAGEQLPEVAEVKTIFKNTVQLWHQGLMDFQNKQKIVEAAYREILTDL